MRASGTGLPVCRTSAPPTTSASCPSQTTVAPPRADGRRAIRRHVSVAGLYAAARAKSAGHVLPSGLKSPTKTSSSRPVHVPTGDWDGASGDLASLRHVFVAGLYAAPSENASPQQPPPQPIISRPVHTTRPPPEAGVFGNSRHWFLAGLYARSGQTSISLPVQNAG